jgi:hypothetical protein
LSGKSSAPEGAKKPLLPLKKPAKKACKKSPPLFTGQETAVKCLHPLAVTVLAGMVVFCLAREADARGGGRGGGGGFRGGGSYGSVRQAVGYGSRPVSRPERPSSDSWENSRDIQRGQYGSVRQNVETEGLQNRGEERIDDRNSRQERRQERRQRIEDSKLGEYAALREVRENRDDFIYYAYDDYWYDWDDWYLDNYDYYDHWYYPADESVDSLTAVEIGAATYYYTSQGYWYLRVSEEGETGYVRISTPAGYEAAELPPGYTTITADGKTYYVSNGTFYIRIQRESENAYLVVTPAFGVEVPELPRDAVAVQEEGRTYYQHDLTWYRKITDDGKTTYVVVASPFKK